MEAQKVFPYFKLPEVPVVGWREKVTSSVVFLGILTMLSEWTWRTVFFFFQSTGWTLNPVLYVLGCAAVISSCGAVYHLNASLAEALKALSQKDTDAKAKDSKILEVEKEVRKLRAMTAEHTKEIRSLKADLTHEVTLVAGRDAQIRRLGDTNKRFKKINTQNQEEIAQLKERLTEYHRRLTANINRGYTLSLLEQRLFYVQAAEEDSFQCDGSQTW
ncbi:hypothetical protein NMY22_g17314 [Coprinellus aureogranulatus]|nr:hypothetical protein NMY22_g17314 [Coprinellus aureogranulatus]